MQTISQKNKDIDLTENYSVENLKNDFGKEIAEIYIERVNQFSIRTGEKIIYPYVLARKWLLQDGYKPVAPKQEDTSRVDERRRMAEYRSRLETENTKLTTAFHERIAELKEELHPHSWKAFIEPLLYVGMKDGLVILFSEDAAWVNEYYAKNISELLGKPIKIINGG